MIAMRKSATEYLKRLLEENTTKQVRNGQTLEFLQERMAAYISGAPAKRTAAANIATLIAGGTIVDAIILAELAADRVKLLADADRYDQWVSDNLVTVLSTTSFVNAMAALVPALSSVVEAPEDLGAFEATMVGTPAKKARPLKITTNAEASNAFVTLWRVPAGTVFNSDTATEVETRAAVPSTLYSFADAGVPNGTWDYYGSALNIHGFIGNTGGPHTVVVP